MSAAGVLAEFEKHFASSLVLCDCSGFRLGEVHEEERRCTERV